MSTTDSVSCEESKKPELRVKFNIIPKTQLKSFTELFQGYSEGLVKSEPGATVLPTAYSRGNNAEVVYQFEPRKEDVWVVTFLKCGNQFYITLKYQLYI